MSFLDDLVTKYSEYIIAVRIIISLDISDEIIAMAIDKAYMSILKYTGWVEYDVNYTSALISLSIAYINKDNVNYSVTNSDRVVKSITQGSRAETYENNTITFNSNGLTDDVIGMLPYPKLKVL